jgi:hypothetical protein
MVLELKGPMLRRLGEALMSAFPTYAALEQMSLYQLDWRLQQITSSAVGLKTTVFELVQYAAARGELVELIIAARNEQPKNPMLERFAASVSLSAAAAIPESNLQKIVGRNSTFVDVAEWRAGLVRAEWRTCRVDYRGEGTGTGFLIGPDLVLTNHHVVERLLRDPALVRHWSCRFDHKRSEDGNVIFTGRVVALAGDCCVDALPHSKVDLEQDPKSKDPTDDELDFALIRLAEPIGEQPIGKGGESEPRGWLEIPSHSIDYADTVVVAILQHPHGGPMKLALGMEQSIGVNGAGNRIRHTVATLPGSSGSPVFDGGWQLIALHHAGDPARVLPTYNEGIPIAKILARPKVAAALPKRLG